MRELRCLLRHRAKWQFVLPLEGSKTGGFAPVTIRVAALEAL